MTKAHDYYYKKGSKDRSYNPPHGIMSELCTWSRRGMDGNSKDNKAYSDGWRNTSKQRRK